MKKLISSINSVIFYISIIMLSVSSFFTLIKGFNYFSDIERWERVVTPNHLQSFMAFILIQTGFLGVFLITRHFRNHFNKEFTTV
jgi:hypothetical protein